MSISKRSKQKINKSDLRKLATIAKNDREEFFNKYPYWKKLYSKKIICVSLCQGAALHYIDFKNGVKDFDVWTFYRANNSAPFPYRRVVRKDFGISKFGKHPNTPIKGRYVDLIGRSIKVPPKFNPIESIQYYLINNKNKSPRKLAQKPVIIIYPEKHLGKIAWPLSN